MLVLVGVYAWRTLLPHLLHRINPVYAADRLERAGVGRVEVLPHDTCADEVRFFSYRRTTLRREERFGLQLSAIALEG